MSKGKKTGGRKAGTPNKTTGKFKEAILETFHRLGGVDHMVQWAQANTTEFYKIGARLIPHEITGPSDGSPLPLKIEMTDASASDSEPRLS